MRKGGNCSAAAACISAVVAAITSGALAQDQPRPAAPAIVSPPVTPRRVIIPPEEMRPSPQIGPPVTVPEGEPLPQLPPPARAPVRDPSIQLNQEEAPPTRPARALRAELAELLAPPEVNVAGITANANPPDTVGDVGPNHYVQMVNATQFQIYDKTGASLLGPATFGDLWPVGDTCRSNTGDPIVVYDHLADRWVLSQFANPNHMCIAVSQTADPTTGMWFVYTFNTVQFPDYPKFGVWPDGYYMSSYESPNLGVYVFDRANMLAGNPATFMKSTIAALGAPGVRDTRILPADLDGAAPAAGTPNFFVRTVDGQQDPMNPNDRIEVYNAVADFTTSTFTFMLANTLTPTPFQTMLCNRNGSGVRDCIPQPDTNATVDALSNRPMMQLKYRNFGTHQAMVFNQTIDVAGSMPIPVTNEVAGIRWYELRNTGAGWTIFQQATYAPQPAGVTNENQLLHRWMGSTAIDGVGNISLAYSITNDDDNNEVFPGIRYAGRHFNDPIGTLPQGEITIFDGANSQTGGFGQRWGDYSALSIDPRDDCGFWFTTHLAGAGGTGARPTRVAAFRFDNCPPADLLIAKADSPDPVAAGGQLLYTLTVTNNGPGAAGDVEMIDTLPAGVSYVSDDGGCTPAAGVVSCSLGDLSPSATKTIQITVKVDDLLVDNTGSAVISNEANVSSPSTPDPDLANNTAVEETSVLPGCGGVLATIVGTPGPDHILDTPADDVIATLAGDDVVVARRGNDAICTGGGDDDVASSAGADHIEAGPGDDHVRSGRGVDEIDGGAGDDSIVAGAGDDTVDAGPGNDMISAGPGNDEVDAGLGSDHISGGPGIDTCVNGEIVAQCE